MQAKTLLCVCLLVLAALALSDAHRLSIRRRGAVTMKAQRAHTQMFNEFPIDISQRAIQAINRFLDSNSPVGGEELKTWREVFTFFHDHQCDLSLHGGSACSLLRGQQPRDADTDFHCDEGKFVNLLAELDPPLKAVKGNLAKRNDQLQVLHAKDFDFEQFPNGFANEQHNANNREYTANGIRFNPLDVPAEGTRMTVKAYAETDVTDCTGLIIRPGGNPLSDWIKPKEASRVFKLKAKGFHFADEETETLFWTTLYNKIVGKDKNFGVSFLKHVFHFLCQYCNPNGIDKSQTCPLDVPNLPRARDEKCRNMWAAIAHDLNKPPLQNVYADLVREIGLKAPVEEKKDEGEDKGAKKKKKPQKQVGRKKR